jgi:hypothetical protein
VPVRAGPTGSTAAAAAAGMTGSSAAQKAAGTGGPVRQ